MPRMLELASGRWARLALLLVLISSVFIVPAVVPVSATGTNCITSTSPSGTYTVTPCITAPADLASITGDQTISATYTTTGANPGVAKLIFYLGGNYLITDYGTPYTFTLPSTKFVDGSYSLAVAALMKDGFTSQLSSITVTFNNGITTPPVNNNTFTPTSGTTPPSGQPFVLAAAGDGADGANNAGNVTNQIASWDPNLFLYLGDVYEKGTPTEFSNWYGSPSTFFGRFRSKTDPVVGNHEYEHGAAPGYFDYWDNVPSYYSYDAHGWHFVALNSNCGLLQDCAPGQAQYQWLLNDLNTHTNTCTIAYFHHPVFNVGYEGYATAMNDIWALMAQHGVDIVLTGHDHDYQRWMPLDGNSNNQSLNGIGNPSPTGMTEFVVGSGGHGIQQFKLTDSRMAIGFDTSPNSFGALRMQLNQDGAGYQFITHSGNVLDSGAIPCNGAPTDVTAPSAPANMTATTHSSTQVDLSWNAANDNVGVVGYDIYRNGDSTPLTSVAAVTSYSDTNLTQGATYSYQVKARDAAGNASAFSNIATVTMPSLLFSDGFESGLGTWDQPVTNLVVQQQEVYAGAYAARATSTGTAASYASKTLSATKNDLYYSLRFKIISKSSSTSAYVQRFRTSADGPIAGVLISGNNGANKLGYKNDITGGSNTTGPPVTFGVWHQVQTHLHIHDPLNTNDPASQIEIWYDGTLRSELSTTDNFGTGFIGRVRVGDSQASDIYDVALDDVGVNTSFIDTSDTQSPSVPTNLTATASAPNAVNLTWNAATDNVSVSGYDIYRNGSLLTTVGAVTNYSDTPVTPAFTYQYQVLARDAAGNVSALSTAASITTPADTAGPSVTLTAPANGFDVSANVTLSADAADNVGVEDVDFLIKTNINGTDVITNVGTVGEGGPYNMVWNSTSVPDGPVTITARAVDTSGNATDANVTVTVNNAGGDASPPTVPPNFAATAAGSSQVDLSWTASTDNVAVTGYDIYRDGAPLASIGAVTSYSDSGVTIGTTYQYQVQAHDAALNVSALTAAASVTIPALLFSDGFESGLAAWTNTGLTAQQQELLEGANAVRATSTGTAASYASNTLSTTKSDLYYRTWFKIISQGATSAYLQRFRTGTNTALLGVFVSNTGKLSYRNDLTSTNSTGPSVTNGVWHKLQTHVKVNGASSQVEIWYDGAPVSALSKTDSLGANPITRIQLGDSSTTDIYDVAFDEVAYDTSFIQSSSAPYTLIDAGPSSVTTTNAASFSFSSTAAGASFECSLDSPDFSACTSPQSLTALADGAHTFKIRSIDALNNVDPTPASRTWNVDTTAPTITAVSPLDATTDVPITTSVDATFSEPMNQASLSTSSFTLVPQGDTTPIAATISYDSATNKATLHPTAALGNATTYVATIKGGAGGATDAAGNPLAADMVWSFTTFAPDTTYPTVTLTAPADGATVSGSVTLSTNASDNVGIDYVNFLVDDTVIFTDTTAPYSTVWNTTPLANGPAVITARAVDTSGNAAISTGSNVTIANDVTPPSAPTNLTANAVSSGQADLTWTAATDDVGVTGYDIYRDGTQLASVGAVTSYSDTTTDPATTYQYQVSARDAAGHVSALSTAATATTPAALFSDGFETGDLSGWTTVNGGLVVQQQQVHTGADAAQATVSGTAVANARKQFSTAQYELYYTTWFKIMTSDQANSVYLQRFIKADTLSALGVYVSSNGKLGYRNDISKLSNTSTINVTSGVWHQVKTHVHIDAAGGPGQVDVWFDGAPVAGLSQAEALGNAPIKSIQLGDSTSVPAGRTYDVAFDDVVVTTPADATPPTVTLTAPASGATISGTVTLAATASDNIGVDHVDFLVNGNMVGSDSTAPYSISWDSAATGDGPATITARAVDTANNMATSAGASVTVDNTSPDTTITAGPAALIITNTVSLSFSATEAGATFACSLDGAAFADCASPTSYTGLADGAHTFRVQATDGIGNTDASPASLTWIVDTVAPTITSVTPADGATNVAASTNVTVTFGEAMDPATLTTASFYLRTKQGNNPVAATVSYNSITAILHPTASLAPNTQYRVTVKGGASGVKDLAGNPLGVDYIWLFTTSQADTTPPDTTITAGPSGSVNSTSASFSFTATEAGSTFECKLDSASFAACTSPQSYTGLAAGSHTFQVHAKDAALNVDPTPASRTWTIDITAPTVASVSPAASATGVAITIRVDAIFSENIDATTLTNNFILVKQGTTTPIAATLSYDTATRTASLQPSTSLAPNTLYTATVKGGASGAKDLAGNPLTADRIWSFTTALAAPSGLAATAISTVQINLAWTDNSSNESGFKIERSTDGTNFTQIAAVGLNVTTYQGTGLTSNTTYYYRVRAYNAAGDSAYSNVANAKTPRK